MIKVTVEVDGQTTDGQTTHAQAPASTRSTPTAAPAQTPLDAIQRAIAGGAHDGGPAPVLSASQGSVPLAASIASSGTAPEPPPDISAGPASHEPFKVQP